MKKIEKKIAFLFLSGILLGGCTTDSVSDLTEIATNENVSYLNDVKPIIDNNCIRCHGNPTNNGAPMSLTTYENVRTAVLNNLIDRISRAEGTSGAMPLGGPRLSQNQINTIIAWQNANFPQ